MTLRISSFGLRGHIGESLTIRTVMDYASAFGTFIDGGRVLLARDTRYSSPMLHSAVSASLMSCGCEIVDLGICPTPMLQYSVKPLGAAGGISISGVHHGMGWNSLTLIGEDGAFMNPAGGETVLDTFHSGDYLRRRTGSIGSVTEDADFAVNYFAALAKLVNVEAIRAANMRVLIDPLVGAGCPYLVQFSDELGFELIAVNDQPSGYLPREAEPRPRSALQMASFIEHVDGHAGFVLNSDMSRMSMVTEMGEPASEEYTFAVVADHVLGKTPGVLVTNCCSTRTVDDIAAKHGCEVVKTPVGQAHIAAAMEDESGVVGGEGSGSAMISSFSRGFDGFLMMALVLEAMAVKDMSLSKLLSGLPRYHIVKKSIACGSRRGYSALEHLKEHMYEFGEAEQIETIDGIRINWKDGWVHARASHTEQIVRVISESEDEELAASRADMVLRTLGSVI